MLKLILGPMKSSKSTRMLQEIERYYFANRKCIILRPDIDTRHNLIRNRHESGLIESITIKDIHDFCNLTNSGEIDVVGIDECQFFTDWQAIDRLSDHKIVIASALNGTAERKKWDTIQALIPLADDIIYMKSVCEKCGADGSFTSFIGGKTEQIVVGDSEYETLCRSCWNKQNEMLI